MKRLTLKLIVIGFLISILLIPPTAICSLNQERMQRRNEVTARISRVWGHSVRIAGFALKTPTDLILPDRTEIEGRMDAELRHRGIYKIPLYSAKLKIKSTILLPAPESTAHFVFAGLSEGEMENLKATVDGSAVYLQPEKNLPFATAVFAGTLSSGSHEIVFEFTVKGTQMLRFVPMAQHTKAALVSNWPHPDFSGSQLPSSRNITAEGFTAVWEINGPEGTDDLFYEAASGPEANASSTESAEEESGFGVHLYQPVDIYQQMERALKYAVLFISLTFLAFFIFEALHPIQIHPLQYLFVGLGLCLFYLLLLSLAEHTGFEMAYLIASIADISLITLYAKSVLGSVKKAALFSAMLVFLYAFLYIILQLEIYSLLAGSIGLFLILAGIMYMTRRIDWYSKQEEV